jgi:hypothetical protein
MSVLFRQTENHTFGLDSGGNMVLRPIPINYMLPIYQNKVASGDRIIYPYAAVYTGDNDINFYGLYSNYLFNDDTYIVMMPFEEGQTATDVFEDINFTPKTGHRFYGSMLVNSVIDMGSKVVTGQLKDSMYNDGVSIFQDGDLVNISRQKINIDGSLENIIDFNATIDTVSNVGTSVTITLTDYPSVDIDVAGTDDFVIISSVTVRHDDSINKLKRYVELVDGNNENLLVENIITNGAGIINKEWLISFTSDTTFEVVADGVTGLPSGSTNSQYTATGEVNPYFVIPTNAWVSPVNGNTFTIKTVPVVSTYFLLVRQYPVINSSNIGITLPVVITAHIS